MIFRLIPVLSLFLLIGNSIAMPLVRTDGEFVINIRGAREKQMVISDVRLQRRAMQGFTRFVLKGISQDGDFYIKIAFDDMALIKRKFTIPGEARCKIFLINEQKEKQTTKVTSGYVQITHLDADSLSGTLKYTGMLNNRPIKIKGHFQVRDGLS